MDQGFPKSTIYSVLNPFERTGSNECKRGSERKAIKIILRKREALRRAANHKTGISQQKFAVRFGCSQQGCRKRGAGGPWSPHKIWTRGEKGLHFLALFGLYAINQYFLVTLFPHRVNLPAHSNFSIRSHTVITTYCSVKINNFGNFQ